MNKILKIGVKLNRFLMILSGILFCFYVGDVNTELEILALLSAIVLGVYQVIFALTIFFIESSFKPKRFVFLFYFALVIIYLVFYLGFLWNYLPFYNEQVFTVIATLLAIYLTFFVEVEYADSKE